MNKIPMLEKFAAQSLIEHDGELIFSKEKFAELIVQEFAIIVQEEIKLVEEFKSTAIKADVIKCHQSKIWHFHKLIDKSKKQFGVE